MTAGDIVLEARDVSVHFGGLKAVDGMDIEVRRSSVTGLMGPNGAGKTTFFNTLSGHQETVSGVVSLEGEDVTHLAAHARAKLGIARTFQLGGLVDDLTVLENVALGVDHFGRIAGNSVGRQETRARARKWVETFGLGDVVDRIGGDLGAGLRRKAEIARTLAAGAHVVLLDEPAAGLSKAEREDLTVTLREIAEQGKAVLVTDHSTDFLFASADEVVVMNFGTYLFEGTPEEVQKHPDVIRAYLGGGPDA
ncbi:MAG: ATP-binding cassette domain-containing protein [Acidimicrobiia bacterium]|nr:ATP-binding cassette domain-containing protein [Acidimicrobiia bacterium]